VAQIVPDADLASKFIGLGATGVLGLLCWLQMVEHRKAITKQSAEHKETVTAMVTAYDKTVERIEAAHFASITAYREMSQQLGADVKGATEQALSVYASTANTLSNVALQCAAQTAAREKAAQIAAPVATPPAGRHPY
jgi:hypothetical protein